MIRKRVAATQSQADNDVFGEVSTRDFDFVPVKLKPNKEQLQQEEFNVTTLDTQNLFIFFFFLTKNQ